MNKLVDIIAQDARQICSKVDLSELFGKTVLITGASGLLGTYLVACLKYAAHAANKPINVVAVIQSEPLSYWKEFLDNKTAVIFRGDLTDDDFLKSLPVADCVIHAAGYGQPGKFLKDPVKTLQLNTSTTLELFNKFSTKGKFVFISTSEVYSGLSNPPYKETQIGTTNTTHPRACYIEGKRCGEAITYAFRAQGYDAKVARLALAYGPGTKPGDQRVLNSFIYKAIQGKIDLLDQGLAKRTYLYVSDAVEMIWKIFLKGKEPVYNVGGMSRITIGELANKVGQYMNVPVIFPKEVQGVTGAPEDVYLDMAKVLNEFGKNEFVPLEEGLMRTIEWQKALYKQKKGSS